MSKSSRKRNKLARQLAKAEPPASGNMLDRMQAIESSNRSSSKQWPKPDGSWNSYKGSWSDWLAGKPSGTGTSSYSPSNGASGGHSSGGHVFHSAKDKFTFTCASNEIADKCPIAETPDIHVPRLMWDTFIELADACDTEWIALLLGRLPGPDQKVAEITGFYFPPQTATSTSVDIPTGIVPKAGVIGAIHSHVDMSAFFSGTDKAHSNWPLEIVINSKGNYDALIRYELKCGSFTKQQTKVLLLGDKPDPPMWPELSKAFSLGAKLAKRTLAPDLEPEPIVHTGQTAASQSQPASQLPLVQIGGDSSKSAQDGSGTGTDSQGQLVNEHVPDDGSAIHEPPSEPSHTDCDRCDGTGMMDMGAEAMLSGYYFDVCDKCNGWGKLLDGHALSAQGPKDIVLP